MGRGHAGKVAVVTGAAAGIGQAFARRLAEEGVDIAIADVAPARATEAMVETAGRTALSFICDVSSPEGVRAFAAAVLARYGHVDILVNNAGIYPTGPFAALDYVQWRTVLAVNLDAAFLMCQAFVPGMVARRWGRVVNVTSDTVWLQASGMLPYIASKAGLIGLTRALATEVGAAGVTVNAIAPGLTRTATTASTRTDPMFDAAAAQQTIKRVGAPEDLVGTVAFLTSDDAAFVTGQTIMVDGGRVRL